VAKLGDQDQWIKQNFIQGDNGIPFSYKRRAMAWGEGREIGSKRENRLERRRSTV
jgi:hypothetical protein